MQPFDEFFILGKNDALICVETQTFSDGRLGLYASTERLSQQAFRDMLKSHYPERLFTVEYGRREYKAISLLERKGNNDSRT